ncbi:MAG: HAD hydrolase-like protein, partial [Desulfobulbaceae bacterium]
MSKSCGSGQPAKPAVQLQARARQLRPGRNTDEHPLPVRRGCRRPARRRSRDDRTDCLSPGLPAQQEHPADHGRGHGCRRAAPPADELLFCIGPPLIESFAVLIPDGSPNLPRQAVLHYRDRFDRVGKFENHVYEDIPAALTELQELGCRLYLATSKAEYFARQILDHFGLSSFFTGIHGARLDGSLCDKGELIGHILHQEGLSAEETLMVGDRKHDMIGAAKCRVGSITVTYGFGSADELTTH